VAGWAASVIAYVVWPQPLLLVPVLLVAAGFTALLAAHVVAFTVRAGALWDKAISKIPADGGDGPIVSRRRFVVASLGGLAALIWAPSSSLADQGALVLEAPGDCKGIGTVDIKPDGSVAIGQLTCTGNCAPGQPCTPQTSNTPGGGTRTWCGCPGVPEPTECHLVLIREGGTAGVLRYDCDDPCKNPRDQCCARVRKPRTPPNRRFITCTCNRIT
jgi:hypothetical protein